MADCVTLCVHSCCAVVCGACLDSGDDVATAVTGVPLLKGPCKFVSLRPGKRNNMD